MRGVEIAAIARSAGFDCLFVDLEQRSFSTETVSQISIAATALGIAPLVRVPGKDEGSISRALETGAQGVIVPHLETRSEAEMVVEAARFPPRGERSLLVASAHTLFRGGPAVETMRAPGETGKSANIGFRDADLEKAAGWNVQHCFFNAGQPCHAPSRMLVHESQVDAVIPYLVDEVAKFRIGDPLDLQTTLGPVVSKAQLNTVQRYIQVGVEEGSRMACRRLGATGPLTRAFS